jgi:Arc/MetJ-type ribon-helix-helix transcriptional regulator
MAASADGGVGGRWGPTVGWILRRRSPVVPICYRYGMSKQIAVRLPEDLVDFVDQLVSSGAARSRAAVLTRSLERERRRAVAARDAQILARTGPDPDLSGFAEHAAGLPSALA